MCRKAPSRKIQSCIIVKLMKWTWAGWCVLPVICWVTQNVPVWPVSIVVFSSYLNIHMDYSGSWELVGTSGKKKIAIPGMLRLMVPVSSTQSGD